MKKRAGWLVPLLIAGYCALPGCSNAPAPVPPPAPVNAELSPAENLAALRTTIDQKYAAKDWEGALKAMDAALQMAPADADLRIDRADLLADLQRNEAAEQEYAQAIKLSPQTTRALRHRADHWLILHQYPAALQDLDAALRINAGDRRVHSLRGQTLYYLDDFAQALEEYNLALNGDGGDLEATEKGEAFAFRAEVECWLEKSEDAARDLDRALTLDPDCAMAYFTRGQLLRGKDDAAAVKAYTRALELEGPNAGVYYNRGIAYFNQDQWLPALADFDRAVKQDPTYAPGHFGRGLVYAAMDEPDRARQAFDEAIRLNPADADFYENRSNLRRDQGDEAGAKKDEAAAAQLREKATAAP